MGWFRHFHRDETASGATEFLILTPVYLLFLIGLFSMGHIMIVRQALVSATRNVAWDDSVTSDVGPTNIPGPFRGELNIRVTDRPGFVFNEGNGGKITQSMLWGSGGFGSQIAIKALNNEPLNEDALTARTTYGTYRYDGLNFGPALTQSTRAAVCLPKKHKRKVYQAGGREDHVAIDWSKSTYYDPSEATKLPVNPEYDSFTGEGIWVRGARVNRNVNGEHSFFRTRYN